MLLSDVAGSRDNNYALLRLLAALAVVVSHSHTIVMGDAQLLWPVDATPGSLAVDLFFVISGFLVTRSLTLRQSGTDYVCARVLRIFPALAINLLFVALVLGPLLSTWPPARYFADVGGIAAYVWQNLQMLLPPYPISDLPGGGVPNGALWTLPVETACYVMLLSGWVVWRRARPVSVRNTAFVLLACATLAIAIDRYLQTAGFHLAWMFASGALFHALRHRIRLSATAGAAALVALLLSAASPAAFDLVLLPAGPYLVFCLAYLPDGAIRRFNRLGDYSYGVYIYHFPVQHVLWLLLPSVGVWELTALATPVTLLLAVLSWHVVEQPALRRIPRASAALRRLFRRPVAVAAS